jgi:uncharacterized protein YdbL (DUF1318 family)
MKKGFNMKLVVCLLALSMVSTGIFAAGVTESKATGPVKLIVHM